MLGPVADYWVTFNTLCAQTRGTVVLNGCNLRQVYLGNTRQFSLLHMKINTDRNVKKKDKDRSIKHKMLLPL